MQAPSWQRYPPWLRCRQSFPSPVDIGLGHLFAHFVTTCGDVPSISTTKARFERSARLQALARSRYKKSPAQEWTTTYASNRDARPIGYFGRHLTAYFQHSQNHKLENSCFLV